ncbi:MAG: hypothetical protein AB8B56_14525 [Crocinitomicaceae bacterium]
MKSEVLPARVAIIEFDSSHDECLLTQVNALKRHGSWVMLVTNNQVRSRNQSLENLVDEWTEIDPKGKELSGAAIGDALIIWRLMRSLKKSKIEKVVFNTAQGGHVRNACLFSLFSKIEFIGIIHTIRKFQGSFTQRLINWKIKKYFVLGEFLKEQVVSTSASFRQAQGNALSHRRKLDSEVASELLSHRRKSDSLSSSKLDRNSSEVHSSRETERSRSHPRLEFFYPLDFLNNDSSPQNTNEVHISIIGSVESRRKDLEGFVSLVQQTDASVHFHFLGKADSKDPDVIKLKEELERIDCDNRVELYENRVKFHKIDQILRKSTAVLPLIHPETPSAKEYFRNQIPGAMSIALGYKIPMLMHKSFRGIDELKVASVYYNSNDFQCAMNELKSSAVSIRKKMRLANNYSSEYQYHSFLTLIFDS